MKWLMFSWWKYLLEPKAEWVSWLTVFVCRAKGHPHSWFTSQKGGWVIDTCDHCGDELG